MVLLLEDIPLAVLQEMYLMHDDAPAHFSHNVRAHLNGHQPECWVDRDDLIAWPPRSTDVNSDSFVWGIQSLVCSTVEDEATLHAQIVQDCQIHTTPGIFEHVCTSM